MADPRYMEIFDIEFVDEDIFTFEVEPDEDVFEIEALPDTSYENDYNKMINHPSINGEELVGNKTFEQLGRYNVTNWRIQNIVDETYNEIFGGQ